MSGEVLSVVWNLPPLVYVVIALSTVWYLTNRVPGNLPPFPARRYPIVGHIPYITKDTPGTLMKWRRDCGDIFSIYLGQKLFVVISGFEIMKEAFIKHGDQFYDRPALPNVQVYRHGGGLAFSTGAEWKEQRSVSLSILKNYGFGRNAIGNKIRNKVESYLDRLAKFKGEPMNPSLETMTAVSNIMSSILIGTEIDDDDPVLEEMMKIMSNQARLIRGTSVVICFPWLKYLPGDLFKAKQIIKNEDDIREIYSSKYLAKIKEEGITELGHNFIADYLIKSKKRKLSGEPTTMNDRNISSTVTHLFQGGTETTCGIIKWALLFVLYHPEIQEKLYQEIVDVIGTDRLPTFEDKANMNYMNAFIFEVLRRGNSLPLSFPHLCSKTTTIAGYTIPKDTIVLAHLTAILHDPKIWGDPLAFRPERFLDKDNKPTVPEQFIPFFIGRRNCLGDAMAKAEMFFFLSGIFQRFHVKPEDPDNLPSLEPVFGVVAATVPFKLRFVPRHI